MVGGSGGSLLGGFVVNPVVEADEDPVRVAGTLGPSAVVVRGGGGGGGSLLGGFVVNPVVEADEDPVRGAGLIGPSVVVVRGGGGGGSLLGGVVLGATLPVAPTTR